MWNFSVFGLVSIAVGLAFVVSGVKLAVLV